MVCLKRVVTISLLLCGDGRSIKHDSATFKIVSDNLNNPSCISVTSFLWYKYTNLNVDSRIDHHPCCNAAVSAGGFVVRSRSSILALLLFLVGRIITILDLNVVVSIRIGVVMVVAGAAAVSAGGGSAVVALLWLSLVRSSSIPILGIEFGRHPIKANGIEFLHAFVRHGGFHTPLALTVFGSLLHDPLAKGRVGRIGLRHQGIAIDALILNELLIACFPIGHGSTTTPGKSNAVEFVNAFLRQANGGHFLVLGVRTTSCVLTCLTFAGTSFGFLFAFALMLDPFSERTIALGDVAMSMDALVFGELQKAFVPQLVVLLDLGRLFLPFKGHKIQHLNAFRSQCPRICVITATGSSSSVTVRRVLLALGSDKGIQFGTHFRSFPTEFLVLGLKLNVLDKHVVPGLGRNLFLEDPSLLLFRGGRRRLVVVVASCSWTLFVV